MHRVLSASLLALGASAQTFVVDASNGPGANFTSIAAAVAAVPTGAVLLVRPGSYGEFRIAGKGLTVLGGPGVDVLQSASAFISAIEVYQTPANEPVVVRGCRVVGCPARVQALYCAGEVLLEDITTLASCGGTPADMSTFGVFHSSQVMLRNCVGYASWSTASEVVCEGCTFTGQSGYTGGLLFLHSSPGLALVGGHVALVDCSLVGGAGYNGLLVQDNMAGLSMNNADVRVLGASSITAGHFPFGLPPVPAIDGSGGTLRLDPAVAVSTLAQPPIAAGIPTTTAAMPAVRGTSAAPGGTLRADALGPVGSTVILVLGFPGAAVNLPGIADAFWMDPAAVVFAAIGVPQQGAPVSSSIAVPNQAGFLGLRFAWQSVAAGPTGLEASNPTRTLVR